MCEILQVSPFLLRRYSRLLRATLLWMLSVLTWPDGASWWSVFFLVIQIHTQSGLSQNNGNTTPPLRCYFFPDQGHLSVCQLGGSLHICDARRIRWSRAVQREAKESCIRTIWFRWPWLLDPLQTLRAVTFFPASGGTRARCYASGRN